MLLVLNSILLAILLVAPVTAAELQGRYLYTLADFSGREPFSWPRVSVAKDEVFVINSSDLSVHVFNGSGMEIYQFGTDGTTGQLIDLAVADSGDIFLLTSAADRSAVTRCNYRGEPLAQLNWQGLPADFQAGFTPSGLFCQGGSLFLVDRVTMKVLVTDLAGKYETGYDLAALIGLNEKKRPDAQISGVSVDRNRNILFTIPTTFGAYIVSPDRKMREFGTKGSTPGKFNIAAGIGADDKGNIYVADTLRCVVMMFDSDLKFVTEFGYRGLAPENLINPKDLAVGSGLLYVTQSRGRGINVYRVAAS